MLRAPLACAGEVTACCGEEISFRKAFDELGLMSQAARNSQVTEHVLRNKSNLFSLQEDGTRNEENNLVSRQC